MKKRIGVLFGGRSAEHDVSVKSAQEIIKNLNKEKYEIILIKIDKEGIWDCPFDYEKKTLFSPSLLKEHIDVIFPILHGPYGEDGSIQGLAKLANLPFVGADILGSAMCMDKGIMKDLLKAGGLPTPRYQCFHHTDNIDKKGIIEKLKLPLFVKPANLGSSLGINKIHNEKEFWTFVYEAFKYDERILIEEYVSGREIECSVLGNFDPIVSLPGEIECNHEFYSYEAKYLDEGKTRYHIPARIPDSKIMELQELALKAFKILRCEGMARIDFFFKPNGEFLINELNTIPGFTGSSLYPQLWKISKIPYHELLDRLIALAMERYLRKEKLGN